MAITRFPVINAVDPEFFGGGVIREGSRNKNVLYSQYSNQNWYATQRPPINFKVFPEPETPPKGRGIVYWDKAVAFYFVSDGVVYKDSYTSPLDQEIGSGIDPVYWFEMGDYLVLLDPENNQGWYIHSANDEDIIAITDSDFPPLGAGVDLAAGGAVLDGFLFIMDTNGTIWNSEINDPTSWNALDFIGTERDSDTGIFLTKHHDNLVAIGSKSIEFFYNAGNPVASPLQRRADVAYRTGGIDGKACFNTGERVYFVGSELTGTLGVFEIQGFQLNKISNDTIDNFVASTRTSSRFSFNINGGYVGSHYLVYISTLAPRIDSEIGQYWEPQQCLVYDGSYKIWTSLFESSLDLAKNFGIVQISERSDTSDPDGRIMFFSGAIGSYDYSTLSQESGGNPGYIQPGYFENQDDYFLEAGEDIVAPIEMELVLPEQDFDILTNKFCYRFSVIGTTIATGLTNKPLYVSYSDDHYRTWSEERTLCTGFRRSLTRMGTFKRRAWKFRYTGSDRLRIEFIEMDVRASKYA